MINCIRWIVLPAILFLVSCSGPEAASEEETIPPPDPAVLKKIDLEFSEYSKTQGMRKAFLQYIDDNGVMLKENAFPYKGARAIQMITALNDSSIQMSWEPLGADIAASADLGYTYGLYELRDKNGQLEKGSYVTIWKKQSDGSWKFVLDSGNKGLGND